MKSRAFEVHESLRWVSYPLTRFLIPNMHLRAGSLLDPKMHLRAGSLLDPKMHLRAGSLLDPKMHLRAGSLLDPVTSKTCHSRVGTELHNKTPITDFSRFLCLHPCLAQRQGRSSLKRCCLPECYRQSRCSLHKYPAVNPDPKSCCSAH
jgi:hypothetical protein